MATLYFRGGDGDGEDTPDRLLVVDESHVPAMLRAVRACVDAPDCTRAAIGAIVAAHVGAKWGAESATWLRRMLVQAACVLGEDLMWTAEQLATLAAVLPPDPVEPVLDEATPE